VSCQPASLLKLLSAWLALEIIAGKIFHQKLKSLSHTLCICFVRSIHYSVQIPFTIMSESSQNSTIPPPSSETAVSLTMKTGLEKIIIQTTAGLVLGGLMGVVLARTGRSGARKGLAGLGAGIGLGAAWTRTSMDLEEMFANSSSKK
jgi:hypothetical protein